jgi:hypothetical protein
VNDVGMLIRFEDGMPKLSDRGRRRPNGAILDPKS